MSYLKLLELRDAIARHKGIIEKARKYIKPGEKAPDGVKVQRGKRGGTFYDTLDLHAARGTTPKKRLPAFRKQDDESLRHRTKTGEHGPGAYFIHQRDGEHHLTFKPHGGGDTVQLGSHTDIRELKKKVDAFKQASGSPGPEKPEVIAAAGGEEKKPGNNRTDELTDQESEDFKKLDDNFKKNPIPRPAIEITDYGTYHKWFKSQNISDSEKSKITTAPEKVKKKILR